MYIAIYNYAVSAICAIWLFLIPLRRFFYCIYIAHIALTPSPNNFFLCA